VISVYLTYLNHENADLRFNALVLLGSITEAKNYVSVYRRRLKDKDTRIRALALRELNEANREDLLGFKEEIEEMLSEPDMKVKQAAINILKRL